MEKGIIVASIIFLIIGLIIGGFLFSKTEIINNTDNSQLDKCKNDLTSCQNSVNSLNNPYTDTITIPFDFMGATGDESNGFGDGWIESSECLNKINTLEGNSFKSCHIDSVQLLFGSDPNPFKSKNAGYSSSRVGDNIFGNGEVFRVKCTCDHN